MSDPTPYPWHNERDKDADALALLTAALFDDESAAVLILMSLDRQQLVELIGTVAVWAVWALEEAVPDVAEHLRRAALAIAEGGE